MRCYWWPRRRIPLATTAAAISTSTPKDGCSRGRSNKWPPSSTPARHSFLPGCLPMRPPAPFRRRACSRRHSKPDAFTACAWKEPSCTWARPKPSPPPSKRSAARPPDPWQTHAMAASRPRVFTIPLSAPFLPTLAAALLDGRLVPGFAPRGDPLALASATMFLPTRRAARALASAILQAAGGEATALPRIVPLGDVDEDALAFAEEAPLAQRPAANALSRKLVLATLVRKWAAQLPEATGDQYRLLAASPAAAIALADSLARLFDDLIIADVRLEDLRKVVPPELDRYWEKSFEFLQMAYQGWFAYLAERGLADPTKRRDELIAGEAKRVAAGGDGPVIAAGSTGSLPAVANLLAAIARRPDGAVILPGLDRDLDAESYALIDGGEGVEPSPGHPQFGLKRLLGRLGISRSDVEALAAPTAPARERLLSEAFRPAATTDRWRDAANTLSADDIPAALADVTLVESGDPREEALSVALILRETLEAPTKTAALVTPDRALARRVAAELARWNIAIDDSAGAPLAATEAGRLARLAVSAAAERLAPLPLVALFRPPLSQPAAPPGND